MAEGWSHSNPHCDCRCRMRCRRLSREPKTRENHRYYENSSHQHPQTQMNSIEPPIYRRHHAQAATSANTERLPPSVNQTTCRFYQRGTCTFGAQCKFLHVRQDAKVSVQSSRPSNCSSSNIGNPCSSQLNDKPTTSGNGTTPVGSNTSPRNQSDVGHKASALKKQGNSADSGIGDDRSASWANAPEFVPSCMGSMPAVDIKHPKSYAEALNPSAGQMCNSHSQETNHIENKICPYLENGKCEFESQCPYIHGDICELCGNACLHPNDLDQRKKHTNECIKQHELDMELSFAVARSKDKTCGVCFEIVMEKNPREQRFGILPNCNHCFCLTCIRKWRQAKQFENKIIRACPECRVTSDFVCPSMYWVDTKEDKEKLIKDYKGALSVKNCKYFKSGSGKCPFGNKCFYLHAYPDGTKADVGPPVRQRRHNADGDFEVLQQIILWDFLDERENRWLYSIDDLEDLVAFFSDSEDSDWSEYDFFFD